MVNQKLANLALIAPVWVLFSCVAPKAVVVEAAPVAKKEPAAEPAVTEPAIPGEPDDGIRLPTEALLAMPDDGDFRATMPTSPSANPGTGAVTVRPPTDPPPRPKAAAEGSQR